MDDQNLKLIDLEKKIVELEKRLSNLESIIPINNVQKKVKKGLSIKEFILTKKPKNNLQKILSIGYFLEKFGNLTSFNIKDLVSGLEQAKEKIPVNINDSINKIIGSTGYIMEAREKRDNFKAWRLTNSGEDFVEKNLPSK